VRSTPTRRDVLRSLTLGGAGLAAASALGPLRRAAGEEEARPALKVLFLGGTSFLGPETVEILVARGHGVTLFNRGRTNPHLFPHLEKLVGDRDGRLDALAGRSWDVVIDTSGYVPRHVRLSAELLKERVAHYLFVSTISVYPGFGESDETITEATPVGTLEDETVEAVTGETYGPLKALCEKEVEKAFPGRSTNVRPGLIVGPTDPTDRFTWWPWRLSKGGEMVAPGDGTTEVQVIDVRDLAAWMVHVVEAKVTGTYNAIGPAERADFRSFLEGAKAAQGSDATLTWIPEEVLLAAGVRPFQDLPLWIPKGKLPHVENARAIAKGLAFRPLPETAKDTAAWANAERGDRRWRAGLTPEREAEVLAKAKEASGTPAR
jgi:2'-hydroxyisoflavone reductase